MKKILLVLPLILISCYKTKSYDYTDIEKSRFVKWNEVFNQTENGYFYFFSYTCPNCIKIKNEILNFLLKQERYYLIEKSNEFKYTDNENEVIGARYIDEFAIEGFPTLMYLKQNRVYSIYSGKTAIYDYIHKVK